MTDDEIDRLRAAVRDHSEDVPVPVHAPDCASLVRGFMAGGVGDIVMYGGCHIVDIVMSRGRMWQ